MRINSVECFVNIWKDREPQFYLAIWLQPRTGGMHMRYSPRMLLWNANFGFSGKMNRTERKKNNVGH